MCPSFPSLKASEVWAPVFYVVYHDVDAGVIEVPNPWPILRDYRIYCRVWDVGVNGVRGAGLRVHGMVLLWWTCSATSSDQWFRPEGLQLTVGMLSILVHITHSTHALHE